MGIIEHSTEFAGLIAESHLVVGRARLTEARIRVEIASELLRIGVPPTPETIERVVRGIPAEKWAELVAEWM